MTCGICKAETREQVVTHAEEVQGGVVVVRRVPAHVCPDCGAAWYSGGTAARLEAIVAQAAAARTEVAVVSYGAAVENAA